MTKTKKETLITLTICLVVLAADAALASTGGIGAKYETGLEKFAGSITGPVAFWVSVIGMAAAGFGLVFGGELGGWIKTACYIIIVVGFIVSASNIYQYLFGVSGALITLA